MNRVSDWLRERRIDRLRRQILSTTDHTEQRRLWDRLRNEINQRSTHQVERMERERGIHRA